MIEEGRYIVVRYLDLNIHSEYPGAVLIDQQLHVQCTPATSQADFLEVDLLRCQNNLKKVPKVRINKKQGIFLKDGL